MTHLTDEGRSLLKVATISSNALEKGNKCNQNVNTQYFSTSTNDSLLDEGVLPAKSGLNHFKHENLVTFFYGEVFFVNNF